MDFNNDDEDDTQFISKKQKVSRPKKKSKNTVSKEIEKEIDQDEIDKTIAEIQRKADEAMDKAKIMEERKKRIPKIKLITERVFEPLNTELREPRKEWIESQKEKYSVPPSYNEEDLENYVMGIHGIGYKKKKSIKSKVEMYGNKKLSKLSYDYVSSTGEILNFPMGALDFSFIKVSKKGERLIDPSRVLILEEEMPPYIRDYIEIPKKKIEYPENYTGIYRFGDKIKFKVKEGEDKLKEVAGIIVNIKKDHFVINGLDGKKYHITHDDGSIERVVNENRVGDKVKFRVNEGGKTKKVVGIITDHLGDYFVIERKVGGKKKKYNVYRKDISILDFSPSEIYDNTIDDNIRKIVIEYIFDIVKGIIPGLEIDYNHDKLSSFGLSEKHKNILRLGIQAFDNHKGTYTPLSNNKIYQGYWKYSFDFEYEELENEKPVMKKYKHKEKIYVPSYIKDVNLFDPTLKDLYYDIKLRAWVYNKYKENVMKKLVDNDKVNVLFEEYFSSISSPSEIVATIVNYLGKDIMKKDPDDIIKKIDENKDAYEKNIHILMVNLKRAIEKNKDRLKEKSETIFVFMDVIKEFIMFYVIDNKERLKEEFLFKKFDEYFKSSPPVITEDIKATFDSLFLSKIQKDYLEYLTTYIEAKKQFNKVVEMMKSKSLYTAEENVKYEFLSNLSKFGFEIFQEIKRYENDCYKISPNRVYEYLKNVLTPFNFLRGSLNSYTKYFQAKLSSREYHIDELSRMCIAHFFPEFSMNMIKPPENYKKDTVDKLLGYIQESLDYNIDIFLESYLTLKYVGHIRTTPRLTLFGDWDIYVGNISEKCKQDSNTGFEVMIDEKGNKVEYPTPMKDIVVCYDEKRKIFTCNNVHRIISDIRKYDKGEISNLPYSKDLIQKMRDRYMNKEVEESIKRVVAEEKVEKKIEKEGYECIVLYKNNSISYPTFRDNVLEKLQRKYFDIKFFQYNVDENPNVEKFGVQKFPSLVLVEYKNGLIKKKEVSQKLREVDVFNFIDSFLGEEIIMEEDYESLFPAEKIVKKIEKGKVYKLGIPHSALIGADKKEVISKISTSIQNGEISFPYVPLFAKVPAEAFINRKTHAKFENDNSNYKKQYYKGKKLLFYDEDYENIDILTSYFTDEARMKAVFTKKGNTLSPVELWKIKSKEIVEHAYDYSMKKKQPLDEKALREGMYFARIPECTNFKISLAISIYNEFKPKVVFDPFAGWGDRALGSLFSKSIQTYIGVDPNTSLMKGYEKIQAYSGNFPDKKIIFEHLPIENFKYDKYEITKKREIDLIFSSPPYFDYEIYSDENSQSIKSHPNPEKWTKWFHDQTNRAFSYLKKGGYLVYYLGGSDTLKTIPSDLIEYMKTRENNRYMGKIPTLNASRQSRPLFFYIWKKND
jgi:hypothetical protein